MYVVPHTFLLLTFIKIKHNVFYEELKSMSLSIKDVQDKFISIIKVKINEETERQLMWLEISLVNAYNNFSQERYHRKSLYERDKETGQNKALISSIIKENSENDVMHILESINRGRGIGDLDLSHFIKRIDLLEDLKT
jgi:hypothetical protein